MSQILQGYHLPTNNPTSSQQSNNQQCTPPNTTTSNPSRNIHGNVNKRMKGIVTSKTLNALRNASRYREALRFAKSQSSTYGPRL